ncbi:GNAT family N-acetyltransferase [Pseudobacillus badius]|uniref:GNAT family N-acetyltransferase n=1 Tax=Bacillus badius TaxID=1455 RepID=UPI000596CCF8|nr:GNAT family N-acetyltransferase [Bacillus badius]KIL73179.1 Spermine/spermidine acetyltransferase [Bacillus badius]KZR56877.1 spermidine acetyltransferase [Bacillus badius]
MGLRIREVTADNWKAIAALSVDESQKEFIESNLFSLAQSKFEPQWKSVGLYDADVLVGYAMYGRDQSTGRVWLDRFMIDLQFQGQGYASRFLPGLLAAIQQHYDCDVIYLSVYPENARAQHVYEKFGFELNGEIDKAGLVHGLVMKLDVQERRTS